MDLNQLEYLEGFLTESRRSRFEEVLKNRTQYLTVALEDVYHMHNASAVIRSCDIFGIQQAHLIESRFGKRLEGKIARGAQQWVDVIRHKSSDSCFQALQAKGYRIVATSPHGSSVSPDELPIDRPLALFFGSEKEGLSSQIQEKADLLVKIPMVGFTESLNISVAAAILLYELGNRIRNSNLNWQLNADEILEKRFDWAYKSVRSASDVLSRYKRDSKS